MSTWQRHWPASALESRLSSGLRNASEEVKKRKETIKSEQSVQLSIYEDRSGNIIFLKKWPSMFFWVSQQSNLPKVDLKSVCDDTCK